MAAHLESSRARFCQAFVGGCLRPATHVVEHTGEGLCLKHAQERGA